MRSIPLLLLSLVGFAPGCAAHYTPPGRGADLRAMAPESAARDPGVRTDPSLLPSLNLQPLAKFPTAVAVARIQAPRYASATVQSWGTGSYSIVTTRDIESPTDVARLEKLPMVSSIGPINRLLLPSYLNSDLELRQAAARMHADVLLVYTLDTKFVVEDKAAPLTVVTLGLSPNQQARVVCTASALLMDTRNGFLYGLAEATEQQSQLASAWTSENAVDETRRRTETKAFSKLVGELERAWAGVVTTYARGG